MSAQIGDVLLEAASVLEQAGVRQARREATAIWASLERVEPGHVWLTRQLDASQTAVGRFRAAVRRRAAGEPLAYVLGRAGFRELDFSVDRRVLIPRPETEGLVGHVLAWSGVRAGQHGGWGTVADIGTGCGCIALSLAHEGRFDRVIATDASADALRVARANHRRLSVNTRVEFRLGPFLTPLEDVPLDVMVSNPPYLTEREYGTLDQSVRDFEPREALVSGHDGLEHTALLLSQSADKLKLGGLVAIEIDSSRAGATLELAHTCGWHTARVEPDLFGRARYLLATKE